MDFNQIVDYYERIAATPKRLEKFDILADLFKEITAVGADSKNLAKCVYLTQWILYPEIEEQPKYGLKEKMLIKSIAQGSNSTIDEVQKLLIKHGDLGEVAKIVVEKSNANSVANEFFGAPQKILALPDLYSGLEKISAISGSGSTNSKLGVVNNLIAKCSPTGFKYLISIILGNMRIGVSDSTIIEALALGLAGDRKLKEEVETAYNLYPDLGKIATILKEKGIEGIREVRIQVGVPVQMMLANRYPLPEIMQRHGTPMAIEHKYDGERCQVHKKGSSIEIFSRNLKRITKEYPDIVEAVLESVASEEIIFEGEIVAMDLLFEEMRPFQVVAGRSRKHDIAQAVAEIPVALFCFDILYASGEENRDLMYENQEVRRELLTSKIKETLKIRHSYFKIVETAAEIIDEFHNARNLGTEGIMCKKLGDDSSYSMGRRGNQWIKLKSLEGGKMADSIDVVIIGGFWGAGRRKGMLAAYLTALWNSETRVFESFTKVGTGLTEDQLMDFTEKLKPFFLDNVSNEVVCNYEPDVWLKPEMVWELNGDEITRSPRFDAGKHVNEETGYSLRFPVFVRNRKDKGPYDATTIQEIIEMFERQ